MENLSPFIIQIIKCACVIVAAVLLGNGAVYFFNKMPAQWFCDYGEEPTEELRDPYTQRIKSHPWKIVFTMFFIIIGIWMVQDDWRFTVAALCTIWLLIEMAIGDALYQIIPDQLIILTIITAVGYIPYYASWRVCVFGALLGLGLMGLVAMTGRLIYRHDTVGGGDIKLFAAVGFVLGPWGVMAVFVMSTLLATVHHLILLAQRRTTRNARRAMVPYITPAVIIYLMFLWDRLEMMFTL